MSAAGAAQPQPERRGAAGRSVDALLLLAALALAAAIRVLLASDWLDYDECQHFLVARSPLFEDFWRESAIRAHPPLVYLAMKVPIALGTSAGWVRAVSLGSGLAGILLCWVALRRALVGRLAAHAGALAIALSPVLVTQSIVARQYALCLLFVWASWVLALRMLATRSERPADHLALAALGLGALASEYSAIFHLLGLGAVLYGPLAWRLARRGEPLRALQLSAPGIAVLAIGAVFFVWHFSGRVPSYAYTRPYLYAGGADPGALVDFTLQRTSAWLRGILPLPWSAAVLALSALALTPIGGGRPQAEAARALAAAGLLGVLLIYLASLLQLFPFGGLPRHAAVLQPAIALSAWLGAVGLVERFAPSGGARAVAAVLAVALFAPGVVLGLARLRPATPVAYEEMARRGDVDAFRAAGGPLVANWRGRALASWWYTPGGVARLTGSGDRHFVFDHGGVRIAQTDHLPTILRTAREYALRDGAAWMLLANPPDFEGGLDESFAALERAIAGDDAVRATLARRNRFVLPTVVMKLERVGGGTSGRP